MDELNPQGRARRRTKVRREVKFVQSKKENKKQVRFCGLVPIIVKPVNF
ncbi:MAG: hypothetical protein IKV89_00130 [Clostridia bacterium]|nr:hypothetical protein [Clostridia bacterium]